MAKAKKSTANKRGLVSKDAFAKMVAGLTAQDIGYFEAVSTIAQGLREANGIPAKKATETEASSLETAETVE